MSMAKKIAIAVWILTAAFLGILTLNYFSNRDLISNFNQGRYEQNQFGFLGFTEPYINHFNRGNVYYKLRDFEKAKQEYQMALNLNPKDPYDCKIRVNYALSYVTPIDVDKIDEDNYKDVIETCEKAKEILSENDCATENNDGHYYAAQKLYNEINDFIKSLQDQYENPQTPTPTPTPTPDQSQSSESPTPTPTSKPDADASATPTPTPDQSSGTPTPTPQGGTATPTPTPGGGTATPTPTTGDGTTTPSPTPGGDTGTPTPTGNDQGNSGTPTPTGGDQSNSGTPTPTGGDQSNSGTPTPTGGDQNNSGTPTPTQGGQGNATPTPTKTPQERIRDIQDRANRERYGGSGNGDTGEGWNFGNSASW